MDTIGTFTPDRSGGWIGAIRTLTINAKVRLVPNDNRDNPHAPVFRVFAGTTRVGDAWLARSSGEHAKDYLRIKLDDPMFTEPFTAAMFFAEAGNEAQLVWNRKGG